MTQSAESAMSTTFAFVTGSGIPYAVVAVAVAKTSSMNLHFPKGILACNDIMLLIVNRYWYCLTAYVLTKDNYRITPFQQKIITELHLSSD